MKLANILTHKGEVKIADLGYSKLVENLKKDFLMSRVGTMLYMSPQILEAQSYTNKTDVWSLGIMFYQMLFGRNPWNIHNNKANSNAVNSLLNTIRETGLQFPKDIKVSEKSKSFIQEILMYDEEDRLSWEEIFQEKWLKEESSEEDFEENFEEISEEISDKTSEENFGKIYEENFEKIEEENTKKNFEKNVEKKFEINFERNFKKNIQKNVEKISRKNFERDAVKYFKRYRTVENIYECENILKKFENLKNVPQMKHIDFDTAKSIEFNGSFAMKDKKGLIEVFMKKAEEDNEKAVCNRVFRFLLQKRNKAVFCVNILLEILEVFADKCEFLTLFSCFSMRKYEKIKEKFEKKALEKFFMKEEISVFFRGANYSVNFENLLIREMGFLKELQKNFNEKENLGNRKSLKEDFFEKLRYFLKKITDEIMVNIDGKDPDILKKMNRIGNGLVFLLNFQDKEMKNKLINADFNKIYEELDDKNHKF